MPLAVPGPPQFLSSPFVGHVTENKGATTSVVQIAASSEDSVVYSVVAGNEQGNFKLHPGTGVITTTRPLDHEERAQYVLRVQATDTVNRMSQVNVIINIDNVNDNGPRLVGVHNDVLEGEVARQAGRDTQIMRLEAWDLDRSDILSYKILDTNAQQYFLIDSSGFLKSKRVLTELTSPFIFPILVLDNGHPPRNASAQVRLVLLKYQEQKKTMTGQVNEDAKPGAHVMTVKLTEKIANCRFSIISPLSTPFRMEPATGKVSVLSNLDYEKEQRHSFIVQAQNQRSAQDYANLRVVIQVLDTNDNAPEFKTDKGDGMYLAQINRDATEGMVVFNVTAWDRDSGSNGLVRYSLVSSSDSCFAADKDNGFIRRRGRSSLVFPWYNLTVKAYDAGVPSLSSEVVVGVRVGEFLPQFTHTEYVFTVTENNRKGVIVGRVEAKSFSGAMLSYSIIQGQ